MENVLLELLLLPQAVEGGEVEGACGLLMSEEKEGELVKGAR